MEKMIFLCNSAAFRNRSFFDFIGRLISGYEIPQLFTHEERIEMLETYQKQTKENVRYAKIFLLSCGSYFII